MTEEVVMIGGNAIAQLRAYMEKIVRLEEQKADISADIRDVYAEAKGNGFDAKAMRVLARKILKNSFEDDAELATMVDFYRDKIEEAVKQEHAYEARCAEGEGESADQDSSEITT